MTSQRTRPTLPLLPLPQAGASPPAVPGQLAPRLLPPACCSARPGGAVAFTEATNRIPPLELLGLSDVTDVRRASRGRRGKHVRGLRITRHSQSTKVVPERMGRHRLSTPCPSVAFASLLGAPPSEAAPPAPRLWAALPALRSSERHLRPLAPPSVPSTLTAGIPPRAFSSAYPPENSNAGRNARASTRPASPPPPAGAAPGADPAFPRSQAGSQAPRPSLSPRRQLPIALERAAARQADCRFRGRVIWRLETGLSPLSLPCPTSTRSIPPVPTAQGEPRLAEHLLPAGLRCAACGRHHSSPAAAWGA